ncbi:MAG: type II toxin-antitoxin system RelE/ParE family toxin [Proteobacteria bacterium]|nr:type II toxin-antitoxin system RelE/ParE family toxin [Pseudomonadota bacterium]
MRDLREYIAKDSTYYAKQFTGKIITTTEKLIDHSKLGRKVPEAKQDQDHIRELIFRDYRIIYMIRPDHLYIVTVIHGSRDLTQLETKPWEIV